MAKRILIIEDEKELVGALRIYLTKNGYDFLSAANASDGIDLIESEKPDLVILDLIMPGKDGREVLKHLRDEDVSIPVIVVSNLEKADYIEECTKLGAVDYIIKSNISLERLTQKIASYVSK